MLKCFVFILVFWYLILIDNLKSYFKQQLNIKNMSVVSVDQVLKYVNQARQNPKKFAQYIQKEIESFIDPMTLPLVPGCNYSTNEGKGAWVQCRDVLNSLKPLPPLKLSKSLSLAAEDHAADMSANSFMGHTGSNGSSMKDRIYNRGQQVKANGQYITMGENIGGDFDIKGRNHALNTVKSLLIDDGVSNRGHRQNLLSTQFRFIGIGSAKVKDKIRVVMDFHSHDPVLKNNSSPLKINHTSSNSGQKSEHSSGQISGHSSGHSSGVKKQVSSQTNTSTSTVNGKTTTKTVQKITYSDGSTQIKQSVVTKG